MDGRHRTAVSPGDVIELLRETNRDTRVKPHKLIRGVTAGTRRRPSRACWGSWTLSQFRLSLSSPLPIDHDFQIAAALVRSLIHRGSADKADLWVRLYRSQGCLLRNARRIGVPQGSDWAHVVAQSPRPALDDPELSAGLWPPRTFIWAATCCPNGPGRRCATAGGPENGRDLRRRRKSVGALGLL